MLIDVKVPILAESVADATLMTWYKQPGDAVKRGDSLIEIETDKVTLEVASMNNGILAEILKGDGATVTSDEVIARIDSSESTTRPVKAAPAQESIPHQQSLPVGDVPGQDVKLSPAVRNLLEEHNLRAADIPSGSEDGRLTKADVLAYLDSGTARTPATGQPAAPAAGSVAAAVPVLQAIQPARAAPAAEPQPASGKKPAPVPATGVPADTGSLQQKPAAVPSPASAPPPPAADIRPDATERAEQRVAMTRLRRRAAERLLAAQHNNAILTSFNEINMQPVMELRRRYQEEFERAHGIRLGYMSFFTRAVVEALKKFPVINASVDGEDIIYHGYFDIGMAVSSPRGLVVPIVHDADLLSFAEIERQIKDYSDRARNAKLTIEELTGGTFTITNGGVFGSLLSTPIINPPQSAILGMHAIQERPVAVQGEVVIRPMMYVALSYDHRIIDGREAVQFLVTVKQLLEDPARLLLQV